MHYVYIMASLSRTLYTSSTDSLRRRVRQHRNGDGSRHTALYRVNRLVYFEPAADLSAARRRELQIKAWSRAKRVALVESVNPEWRELDPPE